MAISPKISMAVNVGVAICGGIATMAPSMFPAYVPAGVATNVIQTAGFVFGLGGIVNAALHSVSSAVAGPLAGGK